MSENAPEIPATSQPPAKLETPATPASPDSSPSAPPTPKKTKKRRTWKQRLKIAVLVLLIGGLLIRIGLNFLLPTVVRKVANAYDLDCTYDRMSLSLITGDAQIWNLVLRPKSGGDSIVHAEYILGSLSTYQLFKGRLVVYRAEVDGADLLIDREPDGSIPLLKRFLSPPANSPIEMKPKPANTAAATTQPVNLQAPLRIDAVRVSYVKTIFRDRSVSPTFETTVRSTLRVSDIGNKDMPAQFEVQVDATPVLDSLIVKGELHNTPTSIDADMSVTVRGLHPKPAAVYLAPLGLRPIANDLNITAHAKLTANTIPNSADVAGQLAIRDVSAVADSAEWASLKLMTLDAKKVNASAVELGTLLIETGRLSARRSAQGNVQIAGFEIVPAAAATTTPMAPAATRQSDTSTVVSAPAAATTRPFHASLETLRLTNLEAALGDGAVAPAVQIVARLDDMTATNLIFDTISPSTTPIAINGSANVPGVVNKITWTGTATPFTPTRHAALAVRADGIKPEALSTYLNLLGIESVFVNGSFTASVDATIASAANGNPIVAAKLTNIKLADQDVTLLDLSSADIKGLAVTPEKIRVETIDVTGPTLNLRREKDGSLAAFGLHVKADGLASVQSTAQAIAAPTTQPEAKSQTLAVALKLPRMEVGRLNWKDIGLNVEDRFNLAEPVLLKGSAGVEASDLVFDPAATGSTGKPGRFSAWLAAPGIADKLSISGTLEGDRRGATFSSEVAGSGITGGAIAEYINPLGIQLTLKNGSLKAKAGATVAIKGGGLAIDADASDFSYADGETELAGVDAARIAGLEITPDGVTAQLIQMTKPRSRVTRHPDGTLEAAGVRLVGPPPSTQPVAPAPFAPASPLVLHLKGLPILVALKQFQIEDGALAISDLALATPLNTTLHGNVKLDNASLAAGAPPATLDLAGGIDGIIGDATVNGTVSLALDAPAAKLAIHAEKINSDALAGYIPPGIVSKLREGRFAMNLDAAVANHADGGLAGHLVVTDLLFEEQADNVALAKVGAFTVRAARIDPAGEVLAFDEISSAGVELDVTRLPDGAISTLGIQLGGAPKPAPAIPSNPEAESPPPRPTTQESVAVVATSQPTADIAAIVADARRALPLLTINKVDLNLQRLGVHGLTGPDAKPIDLARVRLYNAEPIELAGTNAEQRPPLKLKIDGGIDPVVKQFAVAIESTPFAVEPAITIDVTAGGIQGPGLIEILPELANYVEADGLTDGTFNTRLTASLNYGRRGARDLDVARGFTAMLNVKPVEFRAQPDGPVLLGLEEFSGEGIKVQPKTGDVAIKSIDLTKPVGRFIRDEQGLHAMGIVIPLKFLQPTTQPAAAADDSAVANESLATENPVVAAEPPAESVSQEATPAPVTRIERPANEIRLDRLTVSGIDVIFEDHTSTPPTLIPLKTFDLEVRDISNQMLWTGQPIRFDLLCTSDQVPLPPRKGSTGAHTTLENGMEMRDLFSQVTASGRVGLMQNDAGKLVLTGWAKTSVNGFELLGVGGLTKPYGLTIGGGVFDDSNDIRFKEDGWIETRNKIVFTNLSLSEPANGPLQRKFKLPAPIDVALGFVTDPDGSITMNLPVKIENGTVDPDKLVGPVIGAIGGVLVTAIASAPVKALEGVGGVFGLGGKDGKAPEAPVELTFLPGVSTLEPQQARQLAVLAQRLLADKMLELQLRHELSPADIARASQRANPPLEDVQTMTEQLRREKSRLIADRATLAAQTRAEFASQSGLAVGSVDSLRDIDRQLAKIDSSLDQLYELLRPGAANQADRRARAASLGLSKERMDLIESALTNNGSADLVNRVRKTNPQFEPTDLPAGGKVVITLVPKKK